MQSIRTQLCYVAIHLCFARGLKHLHEYTRARQCCTGVVPRAGFATGNPQGSMLNQAREQHVYPRCDLVNLRGIADLWTGTLAAVNEILLGGQSRRGSQRALLNAATQQRAVIYSGSGQLIRRDQCCCRGCTPPAWPPKLARQPARAPWRCSAAFCCDLYRLREWRTMRLKHCCRQCTPPAWLPK